MSWIDVRERLPEMVTTTWQGQSSELVLGYERISQQHHIVRFCSWASDVWKDAGDEFSYNITQWQPLPPPPTDIEA